MRRFALIFGVLMVGGCWRHARPDDPRPARATAGGPMVRIHAGTFTMGDDNGDPAEYPEHAVRLRGFAIDRLEVTNADYARCVAARACEPSRYADDPRLGAAEHPVVGVSWFDAQRYCAWLDRRLPTEAEWEYAARGTDLRKWPWAGAFDAARANTALQDDFESTAPVGSFEAGASPFGVLDLAGNAAEWTADGFDPLAYRKRVSVVDPRGPERARERVVRGGSHRDGAHGVRVSARAAMDPAAGSNTVGFRCALTERAPEI